MKPIRMMAFAIVLCLAGLSVAGCNTIRGMGQDIEKAGEKIQDATDK